MGDGFIDDFVSHGFFDAGLVHDDFDQFRFGDTFTRAEIGYFVGGDAAG